MQAWRNGELDEKEISPISDTWSQTIVGAITVQSPPPPSSPTAGSSGTAPAAPITVNALLVDTLVRVASNTPLQLYRDRVPAAQLLPVHARLLQLAANAQHVRRRTHTQTQTQ